MHLTKASGSIFSLITTYVHLSTFCWTHSHAEFLGLVSAPDSSGYHVRNLWPMKSEDTIAFFDLVSSGNLSLGDVFLVSSVLQALSQVTNPMIKSILLTTPQSLVLSLCLASSYCINWREKECVMIYVAGVRINYELRKRKK